MTKLDTYFRQITDNKGICHFLMLQCNNTNQSDEERLEKVKALFSAYSKGVDLYKLAINELEIMVKDGIGFGAKKDEIQYIQDTIKIFYERLDGVSKDMNTIFNS